MKKFEYKTIESDYLTADDLNYEGIDGWELITIQQYGRNNNIFYFKRVKEE